MRQTGSISRHYRDVVAGLSCGAGLRSMKGAVERANEQGKLRELAATLKLKIIALIFPNSGCQPALA